MTNDGLGTNTENFNRVWKENIEALVAEHVNKNPQIFQEFMALRQAIHCARCGRLIADFSRGDASAAVILTLACALCARAPEPTPVSGSKSPQNKT